MSRVVRVGLVSMLGESITNDLLCARVLDNSTIEPTLSGGSPIQAILGLVKGAAARKEVESDEMF